MLAARPFDAWSIFGMEEQTLNELLCAIVERLGPLPQYFRSHSTRPPKMTELIESNSCSDLRYAEAFVREIVKL